MKFDLWSDLHVDFPHQPEINFEPQNDILVVAGDISNDYLLSNKIIEIFANKYEHVLYVRGNHDHYKGHYLDSVDNIVANKSNAHLLCYHRPFFLYEDVIFVGLNGWYDFNYPGVGDQVHQKNVWFRSYNDAKYIKFHYSDGIRKEPEELAEDHAKMLGSQVFAANYSFQNKLHNHAKEVIIVTHTVPHVKGLVPPDHEWAPGNGSFYNSMMLNQVLEHDKNKLVSTWCFGHTHFPKYFQEEHIRFICNPRGSLYEQKMRGKLSIPISIDTKEDLLYK